jgi:uncharacterized surface protein with fasciclin (FAS1) repeats
MNDKKSSNNAILAVLGVLVVVAGVFALTRSDKKNTVTKTEPAKVVAADAKPVEAPAKPDIVGLAVATPDLSTLVAAVKAADLVTTLQGTGPFTVFAPTNAAFAALPAGTLDSLLLPENKSKLAGILTYHVVAGKVMSTDLKDGQVVKTVNGGNLTVGISGGVVTLTDAGGNKSTIKAVDIAAKNGVVHVIDHVVLP